MLQRWIVAVIHEYRHARWIAAPHGAPRALAGRLRPATHRRTAATPAGRGAGEPAPRATTPGVCARDETAGTPATGTRARQPALPHACGRALRHQPCEA